ncbi:MAG TPA: hypothetical protein DCF33_09960 [Saprospirales bacterium]|nr:hypothetical protein [Saprospirales bacterium]
MISASDNCDGAIQPVCEAGEVISNDCNRSQTFTLTATDDCGNDAQCSVTYTWIVDNNPPTIQCPPTLNLLCGQSTVPVEYPTATDDCGAIPTFTYEDVDVPATCGSTEGGEYARVWTATGGCGLTSSCTQTLPAAHVLPFVV